MTHDTAYLHNAIDKKLLVPTVNNLLRLIRKSKVQFDTIVFRGMSGALIAPIIAYKLDKEVIIIRKGEDAHSCRKAEGYTKSKRFIIIDDFVSSGDTIRQIFQSLYEMSWESSHWNEMEAAICSGVFLYNSSKWRLTTRDAYTVNFQVSTNKHSKEIYFWQACIERYSKGKLVPTHVLPNIPVDKQRLFGILPPHENNPIDSSVVSVASLGGSVVTPNLAIQI
jgi:hypothetical protein